MGMLKLSSDIMFGQAVFSEMGCTDTLVKVNRMNIFPITQKQNNEKKDVFSRYFEGNVTKIVRYIA
jgi:hypothetical protein